MRLNQNALPALSISAPKVLAHSVVETIENSIIYGELAGGIHLTEELIVQRTNISRSPIREALRELERDGLVVREPRRGVRVAEMSIHDLDELYACRVPLEVTAAQLAAEKATTAEIENMREGHRKCVKQFEKKNIVEHFKANVELSRIIHEATKNGLLLKLLSTIQKKALRYRFFAYNISRMARETSIQTNSATIEAIASRDPIAAATEMKNSLDAAHQIIRACLPK